MPPAFAAAIIANIISMIGMPAGIVLDYILYPKKAVEFVVIRFGVDAVLLGVILALVYLKERCPMAFVKVMGVFSALVVSFSFCLMIYLADGAKSPYSVALILIIMSMSTMLPWTVAEAAVMCVGSLLLYVGACLANPTITTAGAYPLFIYNFSFIIIATAVCVSIAFFLSRARFEDFRLRHQLDIQNKKLQDLDRLKTQFFSNVSHELRTPLTLILGPVETLLGRSDTLEQKVHESLILVHRNTLRLLKLINDLLDLTRLDQGVDILRKKSVQIGPFVRGIVESVRHLGLSKQLRMRVEDGSVEVDVMVDPVRIEKVLLNLLTNAIKYTPAGGAITVRWFPTESHAAIEVVDTGVGIPGDDIARIFDRFYQVRSNASNQIQGVGIGLALAKELVEEHKGTLEVESSIGAGTTFRILLALGEQAENMPETVVEAEAVTVVEEPFEKAFRAADRSWTYTERPDSDLPEVGAGEDVILVADDETDMRRYVVSLLSENYRVIQTHHGNNVAALVAEHEPDLVLLDWMMPGKDGLTLCRELREGRTSQEFKIMLLTARIDEKSKIEALRAGADDFLTKPFSSVEVKTRVANLLRAARLQKNLRLRNQELAATVEKLQRTETMLIQSEKMNAIGSLSAGLLHEINNPLNYTLTAISVVNQFKDTLNSDLREIFADIEDGMIRIRDVITHLRNFAYPEKPGTESRFQVKEAFQSAQKIIAKELDGIRLQVDIPEGLILRGQKTQIMHVFINLLSNASKALNENPTNGVKIISVRAEGSEERATIEVADNGPGIPEDIINRIFEPFFTTRKVGAGMGMGLSICHTILESHGGSIRVANRRAGGAIFTINIPLVKDALNLC